MLGLGEFSTTNDTNEGGDVLGDLNLARREKFSVFSFQWSVVSGQWSVVSGQWCADGELFSVSVRRNGTGGVLGVFFGST